MEDFFAKMPRPSALEVKVALRCNAEDARSFLDAYAPVDAQKAEAHLEAQPMASKLLKAMMLMPPAHVGSTVAMRSENSNQTGGLATACGLPSAMASLRP